MDYITWLYAKSRERKKQNNGLLDTRRAIELVIRETGGEKALKELFLKEQEGKKINELSRSNPKIVEAFKQARETGLNALNEFIVNLESSD
jgi:4-hydroxyphenylpyruvate dioxygenase-like putative hemolysin